MRLCACKPLRLHNQSIDRLNPFCSEISSVAMAQFASVELGSRGPTEVPMFANSPSSNFAFHSSFDPQTRGPHVAEPYLPTTPSGGMFLFGEFCLAPATRTLMKRHSPVHLGARALDILIALIEWAGRLVSSAELLAIVCRIWLSKKALCEFTSQRWPSAWRRTVGTALYRQHSWARLHVRCGAEAHVRSRGRYRAFAIRHPTRPRLRAVSTRQHCRVR
jgi:hypothetical protein